VVMKFVLSLAVGLIVGICMVIVLFVLAIPAIAIAAIVVVLVKGSGLGVVFGVLLAIVGALIAIGLFLLVLFLATAPVAVFMTSYALYFLGGRYPRLGNLLWPQPPPGPVPPTPGVPPPPLLGVSPA